MASHCYTWGKYKFKDESCSITDETKRLYQDYFGLPHADQEKSWAPHIVCVTCVLGLQKWENTNDTSKMPFACAMYWMEITNHDDCYFCKSNIAVFTKKTKSWIVYPKVSLTN